jgi:hypothetical protein
MNQKMGLTQIKMWAAKFKDLISGQQSDLQM